MAKSKTKRWRKITNGLHLHPVAGEKKPRKYRKDDILECTEEEMSPVMRRHFKCLDSAEPDDVGNVLSVVPDPDEKGKFNVVNSNTGKAINETPLTQKKAEEVSGVKYDGPAIEPDEEPNEPDTEDEEPEEKPKLKAKPKSKKLKSKKTTKK